MVQTRRIVLGLMLLACCYGCGAGSSARDVTGTISGSVEYNGKPVTGADVNFYSQATGAASTARLDASGNFKFEEPLQTGSYRVFFLPSPPTSTDNPMAVGPLEIPAFYQQMDSSDVNVEVKEGENPPVKITLMG